MVFVWSNLCDGEPTYTLSQVALNDVLMVFLFAPLVALLLGVASAILLANALARLARGPTRHLIAIGRPARVAAGMALMAAFAPLMSHVGYYPAMAVFLAAMLWIADCRRPLHVVAYVAGFLIFSKVVFETILSIPLP
jgi:hypothetical protein